MGLFSKKSDKSSDFDRLPELPALPKSISNYQKPEGNSQFTVQNDKWMNTVKEAVSSQTDDRQTIRDFSDKFSSGDRGVMGLGEPRPRPSSNFQPAMTSRREPLFVRIDKFESALRDFEDISIKIKKVDELISEIKSLREKEDREFSEWEKDLQIVKSRLDSIDRTLFSQLD